MGEDLEHRVIGQNWLESERGWGLRPDGYTLHLTEDDLRTFIKEYWDSMPDEVPDEYTRPSGEPKGVIIDERQYQNLLQNKEKGGHGYWATYSKQIPEDHDCTGD